MQHSQKVARFKINLNKNLDTVQQRLIKELQLTIAEQNQLIERKDKQLKDSQAVSWLLAIGWVTVSIIAYAIIKG